MSQYKIELENFTGPFELLFYLIEKNEMDLFDIPINKLTYEYLTYINNEENINGNEMGEFVFLASRLILIKSKMLLPRKEEEEDPRDELVDRLLEYKAFQEVANTLLESYSNEIYTKSPEESVFLAIKQYEQVCLDDLLEDVTLNKLHNMLEALLARQEEKVDLTRSNFKKVERQAYTIKEKRERIINLLSLNEVVGFYDIFDEDSPKLEIIVTFLAVLELVKNEIAVLIDQENSNDILLKLKEVDYE